MKTKLMPLIVSAFLLSSCFGLKGPKSSSVTSEEPSSSSEIEESNSKVSESTSESLPSKEESSSTSETSGKRETAAWRVAEALSGALVDLASKDGMNLLVSMDGNAHFGKKGEFDLGMGLENAYLSLSYLEDRSQPKIIFVEEDKQKGIEESSIPYYQGSLAIGADKLTLSAAMAKEGFEGNSISVSFAGREVSGYLDGKTVYIDISDLNAITRAAKLFDIDIPSAESLCGELFSYLFGPAFSTSIEPFYEEVGVELASYYKQGEDIRASLLDNDPMVIEMALGLLTEYAKFYVDGDIYSIEFPADYENLTTVFEALDDLGVFGKAFPEKYDFKAMLEKKLPNLNEEESRLSLSFTSEKLLGLDMKIETGIEVTSLFASEPPIDSLHIDLGLHLSFEEVSSIDFPDFSRFMPL